MADREDLTKAMLTGEGPHNVMAEREDLTEAMLIGDEMHDTVAEREDITEKMQTDEMPCSAIAEDRQNDPERRRKILIAIAINMALQMMVMKTIQNSQAALVTVNNCITFTQFLLEHEDELMDDEDDSDLDADEDDSVSSGSVSNVHIKPHSYC
ncbi:unnamed protein product [Calypogeia fissa]